MQDRRNVVAGSSVEKSPDCLRRRFTVLVILVVIALCRLVSAENSQPVPPQPATQTVPRPPKGTVSQKAEEPPRLEQNATDMPVPPRLEVRNLQKMRSVTVVPIDLAAALTLARVQNPELLLAQTRVTEAMAQRQLAAAQFLTTINLGTSYDGHVGVLQQSSGNILNVQRSALFVGAGASAIAAGTVNIPGIVWNFNLSDAIYASLSAKQLVAQRDFESQGVRNEALLKVVHAYLDLLEANGERSVRMTVRASTAEVARITQAFAKTGQGRVADAERAATELFDRDAKLIDVEAMSYQASAVLAELVGLDQSVRYHPTDNFVVPHAIVPTEMTLPEALAIALLQRPELKGRRVSVVRGLLALDSARLLPFSPNLFIGYSNGLFGGGSNLVAQPVDTTPFARGEPAFGSFANRQDLDVMAYWSLLNLGVGNQALIDAAAARLRAAEWEEIAILEQVRKEVASAYRRSQISLRRMRLGEIAMSDSDLGFQEDLDRIKGNEGLPIEVLDSLSLVEKSRLQYLAAIMDFNRAQFDLYVAMGQPPADMLARPTEGKIPVAAPETVIDKDDGVNEIK
jgi:outer membrane protein TolC